MNVTTATLLRLSCPGDMSSKLRMLLSFQLHTTYRLTQHPPNAEPCCHGTEQDVLWPES